MKRRIKYRKLQMYSFFFFFPLFVELLIINTKIPFVFKLLFKILISKLKTEELRKVKTKALEKLKD